MSSSTTRRTLGEPGGGAGSGGHQGCESRQSRPIRPSKSCPTSCDPFPLAPGYPPAHSAVTVPGSPRAVLSRADGSEGPPAQELGGAVVGRQECFHPEFG